MICPNCQKEVPNTARACGYCGYWLVPSGQPKPDPETFGNKSTPQSDSQKNGIPWLWIGLGVVVLVVAVGVVAFMAGRSNGGGAGPQATVAVTIAATEQVKITVTPPSKAVTQTPPASTPEITIPSAVTENTSLTSTLYLAQLKPQAVSVGYQYLSIGKYKFTSVDDGVRTGDPIVVDKVKYPYGLFAHAPSRIVYNLDKKFSELLITVGLADQVQCGDGAEFIILVDGKEKYRSKKLFSYSDPQKVHVSVKNSQQLVLLTTAGAADNNDCDWTVWGDPMLTEVYPAGPTLYDNFNNPAYDMKFNNTLWSPDLSTPCQVSQQEGTMVFKNKPSQSETVCRLHINPPLTAVDDLKITEAQIKMSKNHTGEYVNQGIQLATSDLPQGYWAAFCGLSATSGGVKAEFNIWSGKGESEIYKETPAENERWYTFHLELDPSTMAIECFADGKLIGSTIPKDALALKDLQFERYLDMYRSSGSGATSYVDNVRILP